MTDADSAGPEGGALAARCPPCGWPPHDSFHVVSRYTTSEGRCSTPAAPAGRCEYGFTDGTYRPGESSLVAGIRVGRSWLRT